LAEIAALRNTGSRAPGAEPFQGRDATLRGFLISPGSVPPNARFRVVSWTRLSNRL
jgi:hypothetical protein